MFDLAELEEGVRKIVADLAVFTDDELRQIAVAVSTLQVLLPAGLVRKLGELEARGVCERDFGLSTAAWFAREADVPPEVARALVKAGSTGMHPTG